MTVWQAGYHQGSGPLWWWKVAQYLDEAQGALVNAMVHNLDDQSAVFALRDKLREAQAILLGIFQKMGLVAVPAELVSDALMKPVQGPVPSTGTSDLPVLEAVPSVADGSSLESLPREGISE